MYQDDFKKIIELINTFSQLWSEHTMWTRSFIISTASELGDLPNVTKRLMRNPSDFANALKKYYGDEKANKFAALLKEHLSIAGDLVNAAKAGDTTTVDEKRKQWYANANEIAAFLASINPYWSQNEWKLMLHDHLKMTEDEATLRLSSKYAKDVALYEPILNQAMMMADYMANGIRKQFQI